MPLLKSRIVLCALIAALVGGPVMAGWFSNAKGTVSGWFSSKKTERVEEKKSASGKKIFTHKRHTAEGAACADCHKPVKEAMGMPALAKCQECHQGDGVLTAEQLAGKFNWSKKERLDDEVTFSHETHSASGVDCLKCHKGQDKNTDLGKTVFPRMNDCVTCHSGGKQGPIQACSTCHTKISTTNKPESHAGDFKRGHGMLARYGKDEARSNCTLCHKPDQCTACHLSETPRSHNNYFRHRGHGIAASMDRSSCATCHKADACDACHKTTAPVSHTALWGAPKDRHCGSCHFPLSSNGCAACHKSTPSHATATALPGNTAHKRATSATCRECHVPGKIGHEDHGEACKECHR